MSAVSMTVGQVVEVSAQVTSLAPFTGTQDNIVGEGVSREQPVWASSDNQICSIEGSGEVVTLRAHGAGTATITYTYPQDPNVAPGTITVTVTAVAAASTGVSLVIQSPQAAPPQG